MAIYEFFRIYSNKIKTCYSIYIALKNLPKNIIPFFTIKDKKPQRQNNNNNMHKNLTLSLYYFKGFLNKI